MATLVWVSLFTNQDIQRSNFVINLRTRVDEDTADIITDEQIITFINQGLRDICFRTKLLPEYQQVTPDGTGSFSLAANTTTLQEVIYIDQENRYTALDKSNLEEVIADVTGDATPEKYIREGNTLKIFGSAATVGTLRVYASRIPTLPVADNSYIDLPPQYLELLYIWCEWKYWRRRREPDEAQLSRELYFLMAEQVREEVVDELMRGASFYGQES